MLVRRRKIPDGAGMTEPGPSNSLAFGQRILLFESFFGYRIQVNLKTSRGDYSIIKKNKSISKGFFLDKRLFNLYSEKEFLTLSNEFLKSLEFYGKSLLSLNEKIFREISIFIETFLNLFSKEDFILPEEHYREYLELHPFISGLTVITKLSTTDEYLALLLKQEPGRNTFVKILALYSSRNKIQINYNDFFSYYPELGSLWYMKYFDTDNYTSETGYYNFQRHIDFFDEIGEKLVLDNSPSSPYFSCTYINPEKDRKIKEKMNGAIREWYKGIIFFNKPEPKKIGILSRNFISGHSVYRCILPSIESLKEDYDLTLVHLGKWRKNIDTGIFNKVKNLEIIGPNFDHAELDNKFSLVFYPDVGISAESMILANLRLAPVQITTYGHPVSTFGSRIDYFITGNESEDIANLSRNYYERPVVLPGTGQPIVIPNYQVRGLIKKSDEFRRPEVIIICPWSKRKINYPHLLHLKKIIENSEKKIKFRFFPSIPNDSKLNALGKEIAAILGKQNFEIYATCAYEKYMSLIEEADLVIDSFHFGGYNTVIDSLYLYKPFITLEGNKAYNKFAAVVLRCIGLPELIATEPEEYIRIILRLINDDNYRFYLNHKLKTANIYEKIFNTGMEKYFKKAIDYLLENHENLKKDKSRQPVFID
jgi:hypothetical protein